MLRVGFAVVGGREREFGAYSALNIIELPLFELVPTGIPQPVGHFSHGLISSRNTFSFVDPTGLDLLWGVVGDKSLYALQQRGVEPSWSAERAAILAENIRHIEGQFLFIGAQHPAQPMRDLMAEKGAAHWAVYDRKECVLELPRLDWLVALSPSIIERWFRLNREQGGQVPKIAVMGPTTRTAAEDLGLHVDWMPPKPDIKQILLYLQQQSS